MKSIVIGGGCFWCLEAVFQRVKGVLSVESGYAGGHDEQPTYKAVCNGTTGHAEVIKLTYDPTIISLKSLLEIFFTTHDPTSLNRQGNDVGTQYRSVIYYNIEEEKRLAEQVITNTAEEIWEDPIVTELKPLDKFYLAENYHQDYYNQNQQQGYCMFVINPKITKLRNKFTHLLKEV